MFKISNLIKHISISIIIGISVKWQIPSASRRCREIRVRRIANSSSGIKFFLFDCDVAIRWRQHSHFFEGKIKKYGKQNYRDNINFWRGLVKKKPSIHYQKRRDKAYKETGHCSQHFIRKTQFLVPLIFEHIKTSFIHIVSNIAFLRQGAFL